MSHYAMTKLKIRNPNKQILKRAIENIANRLGGKVVGEIEDFYGHKEKVKFMGIKTDMMYRGVEIYVDNEGNVQVGGDFYGYNDAVEEFRQLLEMEYTAEATAESLRAMGYTVQKQYEKMNSQQRQIVVEGMSIGGW